MKIPAMHFHSNTVDFYCLFGSYKLVFFCGFLLSSEIIFFFLLKGLFSYFQVTLYQKNLFYDCKLHKLALNSQQWVHFYTCIILCRVCGTLNAGTRLKKV